MSTATAAAGSATDRLVARIEALLAATPVPPADADPDELLAMFTELASARADVLSELAVTAAGARRDERLARLHADLAASDRVWLDALGRALALVDQRLQAARRARRQA